MLQNAALAKGNSTYSLPLELLTVIVATINPVQKPRHREHLKSSLKISDLDVKKFLKKANILPYFKININPKLAIKLNSI